MGKSEKKKISFWGKVLLVYIGIVAYVTLFFVIAGEDVNLKRVSTDAVDAADNVGEILNDSVVEQTFQSPGSKLTGLEMNIGTYDRQDKGKMKFQILDMNDKVLGGTTLNLKNANNGENDLTFDEPVLVKQDQTYKLRLSVEGTRKGQSVTVYYGNKVNDGTFTIAGKEQNKSELVYSMIGKTKDPLGPVLGYGTITVLAILGIYLLYMGWADKKGKMTVGMQIMNAFHTYRFLMQQLVSREFKVRYKRSVLGVLWSFVNPLLTMMVQYVVFTMLFHNAIPHYIVYLLIGISFFNFYSEATNGGLLSITGNSTLIKKVYVPKYIYPLSLIFSAAINFFISLGLMFAVAFLTGIAPNRYMLLIPFAIFSIFVLNIGVSLVLATGEVFFRDVQFLYSVFMTLLSYATPLFWDLSMIPSKYVWVFELNPLADVIIFARDLILHNRFPGSQITLLCIIIPFLILLWGIHTFRKHQDEFVLYI